MKPRDVNGSRIHKAHHNNLEGPNWIIIAGGALLSTLTIRLACKLKQALTPKQGHDTNLASKGGRRMERRRPSSALSNTCSFTQDDDCFNCISEIKETQNQKFQSDPGCNLPLVTVPSCEFSSPDRLELPPKPFHLSNCSESPCVSESGSDIFSKREVVQKLRQQLKKRDDMILEMHDQILGLQNSLTRQLCISSNLQSQLEAANNDLLNSERELQHLRKVIADQHVTMNGHSNGFFHGDDKIEMLKKEVLDLKEVVEGKEFLLQNYKEQKAELSIKIKEMQQRLDSQVPNIL